MDNIRNFSIIAHIDHGKSTLADRMLELCGVIEKRKMREQVLDQMELERERGITIKMTPVRMNYILNSESYILNLIDTPGHIDFSYEVSRALKAVEGSILLVDATQGIQAQTLSVLETAQSFGLVVVPVVTKIDSPLAQIKETRESLAELLNCKPGDILEVSGKTGEGVKNLLSEIVNRIPPPQRLKDDFRSLIFDFAYSDHQGIIVYVRVMSGEVGKGESLVFRMTGHKFKVLETGIFSPEMKAKENLVAGEIGYLVTGIKESGLTVVGDTITLPKSSLPPLAGYLEPKPVVWASVYPENGGDFDLLKTSLERLRLSDPAFSFEIESAGSPAGGLGRGFKCGFLGMLHLEIITERLGREFNLKLIVTSPATVFKIIRKNGLAEKIYSAAKFPDDGEAEKILEPWVEAKIITPSRYLDSVLPTLFEYEAEVGELRNFGQDRSVIALKMPLREVMRGFFDRLKNISSGYASFSYELSGERAAGVTRLDILVAGEVVSAFSRIIPMEKVQTEAEKAVERLRGFLPRQLFAVKIQAGARGRIIASRTLKPLRKDVTGYLYGGDVTRKKKLLEKQKRGKKKMKEMGKVNIPSEVFLKMLKS